MIGLRQATNKRLHLHPLAHPAHQIIDTGLDETSCFFADGDGQEVTHGHYFEELSESCYSTVEGNLLPYNDFQDGDFTFDLSRRKVGILRDCHYNVKPSVRH